MSNVIYFSKTDDFADWFRANPKAQELWVGYYKRGAVDVSLSWSDTVDVALCFGWIDGIRKTIDAQSYKIRFTPRRAGSVWSAVNVKKVETLISQGKMTPEGLRLYHARSDKAGYSAQDRNIPLAPEYEESLRANAQAWAYFDALAPSYKRDSIWWVMSAKRKDTQLRRLDVLIDCSEAARKIPMLGNK